MTTACGVDRFGTTLGMVVTDAAGRFALDGLLAGSYRLGTQLTDAGCPHREHLPVDSGEQLAAHEARDDLMLRLAWGARISGRVRTARGVAAPDSTIVFAAPEDPTGDLVTARVIRGEYEIGGLKPGRYHLWASRNPDGTIGHEPAEAPLLIVNGDADLALDLVLPQDP